MTTNTHLRGLIFSTFDDLIPPLLEGTPLEDSANSIAFESNSIRRRQHSFPDVIFSQFAILWIERKAVARMNDRRGATTAHVLYGSVKMVLLRGIGGTCYHSVWVNRLVD